MCERQLAGRGDVICIGNFISGTCHNFAHLLDLPRFELIRHDVTFPSCVEVNAIYILACAASPVRFEANADPAQ